MGLGSGLLVVGVVVGNVDAVDDGVYVVFSIQQPFLVGKEENNRRHLPDRHSHLSVLMVCAGLSIGLVEVVCMTLLQTPSQHRSH